MDICSQVARISALYLEDPGFKSGSGDWLSLWFFMMFACLSNQVPGHYIKLGTTTSHHDHSCPLSTDPIICRRSVTVTGTEPYTNKYNFCTAIQSILYEF